ncbi:MAG: GNAT family N-acetyltransferase [Deltaproteobacteria bacterium]|nr:GNAT family N-acetyltransferase [Deltaproteobacteria bacterium]
MTLRIRAFDHAPESEDWRRQRALFDRVLGPEIGALRDRALRWVTLGNPVDLDEPRRYVVDDGGTIVASLGRMPVRFSVRGEPMLMRYSHDLLVDPAYRGQKLAQRLVSEVAERSDSPVGGLWMNAPSYAIHLRCGWRGMPPARSQMRVLDAAAFLGRRMAPGLARLAAAPARGLLAIASPDAWGSGPAGYEVSEEGEPGVDADALWSEVAPRLGVAAVRDAAYLRWRFVEAPHAQYTLLQVRREGALRGHAALRLPLPEAPDSSAVIVDLLACPSEPRAITALARAALALARARGATSLMAFTTLPPFRRALARLGFLRAPRPQTFVLSNLENSTHARAIADASSWYLTFTDSDGDMWTGAQPPERI